MHEIEFTCPTSSCYELSIISMERSCSSRSELHILETWRQSDVWLIFLSVKTEIVKISMRYLRAQFISIAK